MTDNTAEALAQAFVKKTEVLVQKRIAETALRGLLGAGLEVVEITDWVRDLLTEVKKEATAAVRPVVKSARTAAGKVSLPWHNMPAAAAKSSSNVADTAAAKIAESMKVPALKNDEPKEKTKSDVPSKSTGKRKAPGAAKENKDDQTPAVKKVKVPVNTLMNDSFDTTSDSSDSDASESSS